MVIVFGTASVHSLLGSVLFSYLFGGSVIGLKRKQYDEGQAAMCLLHSLVLASTLMDMFTSSELLEYGGRGDRGEAERMCFRQRGGVLRILAFRKVLSSVHVDEVALQRTSCVRFARQFLMVSASVEWYSILNAAGV